MYEGKEHLKAVHFRLPAKQGACDELSALLNDHRRTVLSIHYSVDNGEKWALVVYEEA